MLTCLLDDKHTEAGPGTERGLDYRCPECVGLMIIKRGRVVIEHFAHKVNEGCDYGEGETAWHLAGKRKCADYWRARGHTVELEVALGSRRTDLLLTTEAGFTYAYEFQRKPLGLDELYVRTRELVYHVNRVVWVLPYTRNGHRVTASPMLNALHSEHKAPEGSSVRYFDGNRLLTCRRHKSTAYVDETDFGGGYHKTHKRWCHLQTIKTVDL